MLLRRLKICLAFCLGIWVNSSIAEVHEFTLKNGLHILVKENHRAPVVVSQVWYKVGGSYEPYGLTGISHLLEHMMFKGTENYPSGAFRQIMSENGAEYNAFTGRDFTAYVTTIEKSRLPIVFELEAERMQSLQLTPDEFQREKQVVLEERRVRVADQPMSLMKERFRATAFPVSPYRQPVIGWLHEIENLTLDDLQQWYQRWYAPNNATLVVVGDVQAEAVWQLAQQYFGDLTPSNTNLSKPSSTLPQMGIKEIIVKVPAKLPFLVMGYKVPTLSRIDKPEAWEVYALRVLANILSGGDSARLPKHLIRGEEIATSVTASYSVFTRLPELFTFYGVPAADHSVEALQAAIRAHIQRLQTKLVTAEELERIKNQLRSTLVYEQDSLSHQAFQMGMLETIGLGWEMYDAYISRLEAVTAEQILAVAKKYLIDDRLTIGILEPLPLN